MFDFRITPDDGDAYEVTAGSRDILQWERTTKGGSLGVLLSERRMVDLYKLAWIAARREGLFTGNQKEFEDSCELSFADPDEEPDPTPPAP